MTTMQKFGYGVGGFSLSLAIAVFAAAGLQVFIVHIWSPPPSLLVTFGSAFAVITFAIASSWVYLLQTLKNEAMIRGVWCHIYTVVAVAVVSLILSLVM